MSKMNREKADQIIAILETMFETLAPDRVHWAWFCTLRDVLMDEHVCDRKEVSYKCICGKWVEDIYSTWSNK